MNWIEAQATSETAADLITADLDYLGRRFDAAKDAGHKGAHAEVDRFDAARFVTGTYMLLGDILRLHSENPVVAENGEDAEASSAKTSEQAADPPRVDASEQAAEGSSPSDA